MKEPMNVKIQRFVIIWLSTLVITFLTSLIITLTSDTYPVTGTFVYKDTKVSYRFEKEHYGDGDYEIEILTSSSDVKGYVEWQIPDSSRVRNREVMINNNGTLEVSVPHQKIGTKIVFHVYLLFGYNKVQIPEDTTLSVMFYDSIPFMGWMLHYITFFLFVIMAVRTALEGFIEKGHIRMYTIISTIAAILHGLFVNPMNNSFRYGGIGCIKVLAPSQIFSSEGLVIVAIWLLALIIVLLVSNRKWIVVGAGLLSLAAVVLL